MLHTSFRHLPGVGPAFEAKLKERGIRTWAEALDRPLPCNAARAEELRGLLRESQARLADRDAAWFGARLAPAEQWRLWPHFRHSAACVDIETNGLYGEYVRITTIALYDGAQTRLYAQGGGARLSERLGREVHALQQFCDDILNYKLLVTWNGRCFDVPILRQELGVFMNMAGSKNRPECGGRGACALGEPDRQGGSCMAHLDLRPVFRALGLRGGLKLVERRLGLDRGDVAGLDGWDAVRLWQRYEFYDDLRALRTLLDYNAADVTGLEYLAEYAVAAYGEEDGGAGTKMG